MQTYGNWDIQEIPQRSPYFHSKVENFLAANGLRLEEVDMYLAVLNADGHILAGGGLSKDIIKCIAVAAEARSEGLAAPLVSRLIAEASARGVHNLKVFTKPENQAIFESMGFKLLAQAPKAILMENGRGLERYCEYLRSFRREGRGGVIVMNANPFTLGHKYLIDKASEQVDNLYIIPVKEDLSLFPYSERKGMIILALEKGTEVCSASAKNYADATAEHTSIRNSSNVTVLEGSDYIISAAIFPTYFLKDLSDAADTQMRLDLDLYSRWIAPALGASVRFVGSEPFDALTAHYNTLIPNSVEIPRLHLASTGPEVCFTSAKNIADATVKHTSCPVVSASKVRQALAEGRYREAAAMCPETTHPYLLAVLAERALRMELDLPMKPGLVCPDSQGAHRDMDYTLMLKGIAAIRPFFPRMAMAASAEELRQLGIDAEAAMMAATGGVNTHRGAIFALGLALNAAMQLPAASARDAETLHTEELMHFSLCKIAQGVLRNSFTDNQLHTTLVGARRVAATGYKELFEDWLPYYRAMRGAEPFSSAKKIADATEKGSAPLQNTPNLTEKGSAPRQNEFANREEVSLPGASAKSFAEGRDTSSLHKLLLRIMSTLDDTCIVKRVGAERAEEVKKEAKALLKEIPGQAGDDGSLRELCERYAREGISPGGAADMLALTLFIDSIINI